MLLSHVCIPRSPQLLRINKITKNIKIYFQNTDIMDFSISVFANIGKLHLYGRNIESTDILL